MIATIHNNSLSNLLSHPRTKKIHTWNGMLLQKMFWNKILFVSLSNPTVVYYLYKINLIYIIWHIIVIMYILYYIYISYIIYYVLVPWTVWENLTVWDGILQFSVKWGNIPGWWCLCTEDADYGHPHCRLRASWYLYTAIIQQNLTELVSWWFVWDLNYHLV